MKRNNLELNENYELIDSFYTGGLNEGGGLCCENCNKLITNVAIIKNSKDKTFNIGMDCAKTLTKLNGLYNAEIEFNEMKALNAKVNKEKKKGSELTFEIYNDGYLICSVNNFRIFHKDIDFSKKYLSNYLKLVNNKEKIGFKFENIEINLPFEYFHPTIENIDFKSEFSINGFNCIVSVKPYNAKNNCDFYLDIYKDSVNIFSKRITMYRNIISQINYTIREYYFNLFDNRLK